MGTKKLGCVLLGIMAGVCVATSEAEKKTEEEKPRTWKQILKKFEKTIEDLEAKIKALTDKSTKDIMILFLDLMKQTPMAMMARSADEAEKRGEKFSKELAAIKDPEVKAEAFALFGLEQPPNP